MSNKLRLYDILFVKVFSDLINRKISIDSLIGKVPDTIIDDFTVFVGLTPVKRFFNSIRNKRSTELVNFFKKNIPDTIENKKRILDHGLAIAISNNYIEIINVLIDQGDIESLVTSLKYGNGDIFSKIFYQWVNTKSKSQILRVNIAKMVKLAARIDDDLAINILDGAGLQYEKTLFQSLIQNNPKLINYFSGFNIEQNKLFLKFGCATNNIELITKSIKNGAKDLIEAMKICIKYNNMEAIQCLTENYPSDNLYSFGLIYSIKYNIGNLIDLFQQKLASSKILDSILSIIIYEAAKNANMDVVNYYFDYYLKINDEPSFSVNGYTSEYLSIYIKIAVKGLITGGHFNLLEHLIPENSNRININYYGPNIIYYLNNLFLFVKLRDNKEIDVSELLPLAKQGYLMNNTLKNIMILNRKYLKLHKFINKKSYKHDNYSINFDRLGDNFKIIRFDNLIKNIFGDFSSLYDIELFDENDYYIDPYNDDKEKELINPPVYVYNKILNKTDKSSLTIYLDNSPEINLLVKLSKETFIDNLINLNVYKKSDLSLDIINNLNKAEFQKQAYKENFIIRSLISYII